MARSRRLLWVVVTLIVLPLPVACSGAHHGSADTTYGPQQAVLDEQWASRLSAITLTAQEARRTAPPPFHWNTTRSVQVTCGGRPSVRGSSSESAADICTAVAYYAVHPPKPCGIIRTLSPTMRRVEIRATAAGDPEFDARMGLVCNPPPLLATAVETIYIASFR